VHLNRSVITLIDTPPSSSLLPQPTTPLLNPINAHKTHIKTSPHPSLLSSCTKPSEPQKCILTVPTCNTIALQFDPANADDQTQPWNSLTMQQHD
jgi:hypothetical protein